MFKEFLQESGLVNEGYNSTERDLALSKIKEQLELVDDSMLAKVVKALYIQLYLKGEIEQSSHKVKPEDVMNVKKVQAGLKKILLDKNLSKNVKELVESQLKDGFMITAIDSYHAFSDVSLRNRVGLEITNLKTKDVNTFIFQ